MCVKQGTRGRRRASFGRRLALSALGAVGSLFILGCGGGGDDKEPGGGGGGVGSKTCREIPEEAPGAHPDNQSLITQDAYYRSDITEGKTGVPLTLQLTLVHADAECAPLAGANVEVWHADAAGVYSEYATAENAGSTTTTYLRGLQSSDNAGRVTFNTVYPGWYAPRAAHVHVRIYRDVVLRKTTQFGFPDATSEAVYGATNFYKNGQNPTKNAADTVFGASSGGAAQQIATVTGDNQSGYVASLTLAISKYGAD